MELRRITWVNFFIHGRFCLIEILSTLEAKKTIYSTVFSLRKNGSKVVIFAKSDV